MKNNSIVLEKLFDVPTKRVWKALTDKDEMRNWYFDLDEFKAEVGFRFQFTGLSNNGTPYLHLCEIIEVIPNKKLAYSWKYQGYAGISFVSFELFEQGNKTQLRLTHTGLETLPLDNPDFALHNFESGWNQIINNSLKSYLDKDNFQYEISVNASLEKVFKSITQEIPLWWSELFEGISNQQGQSFTIRFGTNVFKTMIVEALIPNQKVVWYVTDSLIDLPDLKNKTEWIHTKIVWELSTKNNQTFIHLTHFGLTPQVECYNICENGWYTFIASLTEFINTGIGKPFKK